MYRRRLMKGQVDDVKEWKLLGAAESSGEEDSAGVCIEVDLTQYTEVFAIATMVEKGNNRRIVFGQSKQWYDGTACVNSSNTEQVYTIFVKADIIDGVIYAYGGYNSGYGGVNSTESKFYAPAFSPRSELTVGEVRYVRYDANNKGALPTGETLKVYAR